MAAAGYPVRPTIERVARLWTGVLAAVVVLAAAAQASAAPVLVLDGKRVTERQQRFAGPTELPPPPRTREPVLAKRAVVARTRRGKQIRRALKRLLERGQIDRVEYAARVKTVKRALRTRRRLSGTRRAELGAVITNADAMARAGTLTTSRLEPVFQTIDRNRQWWSRGRSLSYGQRVSFAGSEVIWQYYPGQGIQLQMLGNFGKANALWADEDTTALRRLVDELVPLAADRGGFPAWEYYFRFGGGVPPWTSGMSQGTAVQSLGRASVLLADPSLRDVAARALALFEQPPPRGVRQESPSGAFYLIYSYAPTLRVINAHLQTVVGLYDFAQISGDPRAHALFAAGDSEAHAVLPRYDTGKWSLYDESREADLSYHRLVTTFLRNLCRRTDDPAYCDAARRFRGYERVPPVVRARTSQIRAGRPARLKFRLDKISRVGVTVLDSDGDTVFATSATVGRGNRYYTWSRPSAPGSYTLRVSATDLAGNRAEPSERPLEIIRR
jgi:hypothetical protein